MGKVRNNNSLRVLFWADAFAPHTNNNYTNVPTSFIMDSSSVRVESGAGSADAIPAVEDSDRTAEGR